MRFQNGLHSDQHESRQPEGTYRDALNLVMDDEHGALRNEVGTTLKATLSTNLGVIGSTMLADGRLVVVSRYVSQSTYNVVVTGGVNELDFLALTINGTEYSTAYVDNEQTTSQQWVTDHAAALSLLGITVTYVPDAVIRITSTNTATVIDTSVDMVATISSLGQIIYSEIGLFNGSTYTTVVEDSSWAAANKLNFGPYAEITSRVNHQLEYVVYWTDDTNPPRYLNISEETGAERSPDTFSLFPILQEHPYFQFDGLVSGGSLSTGTYYIALAYVNSDLTPTNWFYVSHPIYLNEETDTDQPNEYDGNYDGFQSSRAIRFSLANLDTTYAYVRIALIKGSGVRVMPDRTLVVADDGTFTHTITGNEAYTDRSLDEIVIPRAYYTKAKTLRQVDNRLYLGNLESLSRDFDYQKYANNIELSAITESFDGVTGLGYKDNEFSFNTKSFRRDEVYAMYIAWVLKDGSETKAFHIPGRAPGSTNSSGYVRFRSAAPSSIKNASVDITLATPWTSSTASTHVITITDVSGSTLDFPPGGYSFTIPISAGWSAARVIQEYRNVLQDDLDFTAKFGITFDAATPETLTIYQKTDVDYPNEDWNANCKFNLTATPKDGLVSSAITGVTMSGGENDEGQLLGAVTVDFYGETLTHNVYGLTSAADLALELKALFEANATIAADYTISIDGGDSGRMNVVSNAAYDPAYNSIITHDYRDQVEDLDVVSYGVGGGNAYMVANENSLISSLVGDPQAQHLLDVLGIPGGDFDDAKIFHVSGAADATTGMGYWENANEDYPDSADFDIWEVVGGVGRPTGRSLRGAKVRHHRFPEFASEPHFEGTDSSPSCHALGFKLTNIQIPDDMASEVLGFKIYFAERTLANKTVLDQDQFLYAEISGTDYVTQNKASDPAIANAYTPDAGYLMPFSLMRKRSSLASLTHVKSVADITSALDTSRVGLESYAPNLMPRVRRVRGKSYINHNETLTSISGLGFTGATHCANDPGQQKLLLELENDLELSEQVTVLDFTGTSGALTLVINDTEYTEPYTGGTNATILAWIASHSAALATININPTNSAANQLTLTSSAGDFFWQDSGGGVDVTGDLTTSTSQRMHLVNLCAYKTDVYSSFTEQSLVWTGYFQKELTTETHPFTGAAWHGDNETGKIFGGDTFISRYSYKSTMETAPATYDIVMHEVLVESDDNIGFRHEGDDAWDVYYPKSDLATFLDPGEYPGGDTQYDIDNPYDYNDAYSFLQNFKVSFPFDASEQEITNYPTRVVRSGQDDGSARDYFRDFKAEDLRDFPRNRGELIHLANLGSTILAHMQRGLFRTRGREEMVFNDVRAFIGSGDILSVEPTELGSTEIGMAGLQDQRAAVVAATGYYWLDREAGRVYRMSESGMADITGGLTDFFEANLSDGGTIQMSEDTAEERVMLTNYAGSSPFTLSIDQKTGSWVSFHSYQPEHFLGTPNRLFAAKGNRIYEHHSGAYGSFYGTVYDSFIEFVDNAPPGLMKQVAYLIMETVVQTSGVEDISKTFTSYRVRNSYQDTGTVAVDTSVSFSTSNGNARRHRGLWTMNVGRDTLNIPALGARRYGSTQAYQKRLIDKWHKVKLTLDNTANDLLYLFHAQLVTRHSNR